jgi:hypothetical protein
MINQLFRKKKEVKWKTQKKKIPNMGDIARLVETKGCK